MRVKLFPDADGRHLNTDTSWVGQSFWATLTTGYLEVPPIEGLIQPVPADVIDLVACLRHPGRFRAMAIKIGSSAVGALVLHMDGHVVVNLIDVAGRPDLESLEIAAVDCRLYAMLTSEHQPGITPLVPVVNFKELMSEVEGLRRPSAREVMDAVAMLRQELRGPDPWSTLMLAHGNKFKSLTVTVCQPR